MLRSRPPPPFPFPIIPRPSHCPLLIMSTTEDYRQSTASSVTLGTQVIDGLPTTAESPIRSERENSASPITASPIVPPTHRARTLVLCFDGTGDQYVPLCKL